ncbi:shikimate dehydrogenase [Brevundimonas sp. BAL450]|uniref:Shikimate dehydrogenase (NADP(+)) n=1 Tax=Brevundimonas abyssalis TAR-001 TaxID=1391729 RepID=A0A8E0KN12_9CAUL|nr:MULTISPECIES: shikimate dehydrogenase [Brevundimonas]MBG7616326.1 shikimate dehydrogenase [Brevundimonas sp. BAL450]GAD58882.1 shikimate 5-dehydrogenase I alpha [Brevundimonas abyssalis TAR-001]
MTITGAALLAGIVGRPVAHSLSPVIHNAWIEAAGMDAVYAAFAPPDEAAFDLLIEAGRAGMIHGLNVTAPFKGQALARADEASDTARACGSANVLAFRDGRVRAQSTDGEGLLKALAEQAPDVDLTAGPVLFLGAGGAARASVAALLAGGAPEVVILNRTRDRAQALAETFDDRVRVAGDDPGEIAGARLVINAVAGPMTFDFGRTPNAEAALDMTYKPLETPFLMAARAGGLIGVDGLGMLTGQAGPSFAFIFDRPPPTLDPRAVVLAHLQGLEP